MKEERILDTVEAAVNPSNNISDERKCSIWLHLTLIVGMRALPSRRKVNDNVEFPKYQYL